MSVSGVRIVEVGWRRMLGDALAAVQLGAAAALGYSFSHFVLGHAVPFLSATVAITSLGLSRDVRPRRVLETAIGMTIGIALAGAMVLLIGKGAWQLSVVVVLAVLVARLVSASTSFATLGAIQASMVLLLPDPDGGPFMRALDGVVGAAAALLIAVLLPRDGVKLSLRTGRVLLQESQLALVRLAAALRTADVSVAAAALERLRATQPLVDEWHTALDSAQALAQISPLRWRQRAEVARHLQVAHSLDYATRNLRVVARRVDFLTEDGLPRPALADLVDDLAAGYAALSAALEHESQVSFARQQLMITAGRIDPDRLVLRRNLNEAGLVLLLRPLAVDLLSATGLDEATARSALPRLSERWQVDSGA